MPTRLVRLLILTAAIGLLASCNLGPLVVTGRGNVELNVEYAGGEMQRERTEVFVDAYSYGNLPARKLVLNLTEGEHMIEVTCPGFMPYRQRLFVFRDPNFQVLYVRLEKLAGMFEEGEGKEPAEDQKPPVPEAGDEG